MPLVVMKNIRKPIYLLIVLLISLFLSVAVSFWFLMFVVIILAINIFYWFKIKVQFKQGDSNGGLIISENPKLIAVTTSLSKGFGNYPVVKVLHYKGKAKLNERVGTVALYKGSEDSCPYWEDFFPIPVDYVTDNQVQINRVLKTYDEESWEILSNRINQLDKPFKEGLFKIKNKENNW